MQESKIKLAKALYIFDAALGFLSVIALFVFTQGYSQNSAADVLAFLMKFLPVTLVWCVFCYGAYKGIKSNNVFYRLIFWLNVIANAINIPIGTIVACLAVWLWVQLRKSNGL